MCAVMDAPLRSLHESKTFTTEDTEHLVSSAFSVSSVVKVFLQKPRKSPTPRAHRRDSVRHSAARASGIPRCPRAGATRENPATKLGSRRSLRKRAAIAGNCSAASHRTCGRQDLDPADAAYTNAGPPS